MAGPRTGCGCMTSRTGCLLIGWLEVIILIPVLIGGLVMLTIGFVGLPNECPETNPTDIESVVHSAQFYLHHDQCWRLEYKQQLLLTGILILALCGLYIFVPCFLIQGANNERPSFLVPYIVCSVLNNICSFLILVAGYSYMSENPDVAIVYAIAFALAVYKTVVVCCHYSHLQEKQKGDNEILVNKGAYINI